MQALLFFFLTCSICRLSAHYQSWGCDVKGDWGQHCCGSHAAQRDRVRAADGALACAALTTSHPCSISPSNGRSYRISPSLRVLTKTDDVGLVLGVHWSSVRMKTTSDQLSSHQLLARAWLLGRQKWKVPTTNEIHPVPIFWQESTKPPSCTMHSLAEISQFKNITSSCL